MKDHPHRTPAETGRIVCCITCHVVNIAILARPGLSMLMRTRRGTDNINLQIIEES